MGRFGRCCTGGGFGSCALWRCLGKGGGCEDATWGRWPQTPDSSVWIPSCTTLLLLLSPAASVPLREPPGCSPASSGTQSKREPRTPGGAVLHVHSSWDHLLDQKVPNRRGNDRMPALTAAEEQRGSRRGGGEPHPALAPYEGPRGFVLERQSREAEAPAALANT